MVKKQKHYIEIRFHIAPKVTKKYENMSFRTTRLIGKFLVDNFDIS